MLPFAVSRRDSTCELRFLCCKYRCFELHVFGHAVYGVTVWSGVVWGDVWGRWCLRGCHFEKGPVLELHTPIQPSCKVSDWIGQFHAPCRNLARGTLALSLSADVAASEAPISALLL
jgi:hypothetical protein